MLITAIILTRIIPALAGNTSLVRLSNKPFKDHPRSRGEYPMIAMRELRSAGSSPLSRGIRGPLALPTPANGIIPALAGNTKFKELNVVGAKDHPRSRGEYSIPA